MRYTKVKKYLREADPPMGGSLFSNLLPLLPKISSVSKGGLMKLYTKSVTHVGELSVTYVTDWTGPAPQ